MPYKNAVEDGDCYWFVSVNLTILEVRTYKNRAPKIALGGRTDQSNPGFRHVSGRETLNTWDLHRENQNNSIG